MREGLERVAARVAVERPAEAFGGFRGFGGFEGGQTAGSNALKNRWLGCVAARVAVERPAEGFGGFEGGQTAGLNALKNKWLGRVAARVAMERPAGGFGCGSCRGAFEAFEAWQSAYHRLAIVAGTTLDNVRTMKTPPVAPGAAPALAKAGVGGLLLSFSLQLIIYNMLMIIIIIIIITN